MANLKISQLPALTAATNNDLLAVVNAGVTKQITVGEFADAIPTFTGNTSASCITTLWVSSISGCSPVILNNATFPSNGSATIVIPTSGKIKLEGTAEIVDSNNLAVVSTISGNISDSSGYGGIVSTDSLDVISDSISVVNTISGTSSATTATTVYTTTYGIGDGIKEFVADKIVTGTTGYTVTTRSTPNIGDSVNLYDPQGAFGGSSDELEACLSGCDIASGDFSVNGCNTACCKRNCRAAHRKGKATKSVSVSDGLSEFVNLQTLSPDNMSTEMFVDNINDAFYQKIFMLNAADGLTTRSEVYTDNVESIGKNIGYVIKDGLELIEIIGGTGATSATTATTRYVKTTNIGDSLTKNAAFNVGGVEVYRRSESSNGLDGITDLITTINGGNDGVGCSCVGCGANEECKPSDAGSPFNSPRCVCVPIASVSTDSWLNSIGSLGLHKANEYNVDDGTMIETKFASQFPTILQKNTEFATDSILNMYMATRNNSERIIYIAEEFEDDNVDNLRHTSTIGGTGDTSGTTGTTRYVKTTDIGDGLTNSSAFNAITGIELYNRSESSNGLDGITDLITTINGGNDGGVGCSCSPTCSGPNEYCKRTTDSSGVESCYCAGVASLSTDSWLNSIGSLGLHKTNEYNVADGVIFESVFSSQYDTILQKNTEFTSSSSRELILASKNNSPRFLYVDNLYEDDAGDVLNHSITIGGTGDTSGTTGTTRYTKSYGVGDGIKEFITDKLDGLTLYNRSIGSGDNLSDSIPPASGLGFSSFPKPCVDCSAILAVDASLAEVLACQELNVGCVGLPNSVSINGDTVLDSVNSKSIGVVSVIDPELSLKSETILDSLSTSLHVDTILIAEDESLTSTLFGDTDKGFVSVERGYVKTNDGITDGYSIVIKSLTGATTGLTSGTTYVTYNGLGDGVNYSSKFMDDGYSLHKISGPGIGDTHMDTIVFANPSYPCSQFVDPLQVEACLTQLSGGAGTLISETIYEHNDADVKHKFVISGASTAFTATTVFITERDIKLATKVEKINNSTIFTIGEDEVKVSGVPLMIGERLNYKSIGGPIIPANTQSALGAIGDLIVDNDNLYFKSNTGWKIFAGATF